MRKQILLLMFALPILAFFLIANSSLVLACGYHDREYCENKTVVEGKIYDATNTTELIGGASVTAICTHNGVNYTKSTITDSSGILKGAYFILFPKSQCTFGDEVYVTAVKDDLSGNGAGSVSSHMTIGCIELDIGIVDIYINLIPEFGTIIGILTLVSALGIFFFVRKK